MRAWVDFLKAEFQQVYIFTVLAVLLSMILHLIAAGEFELKPEIEGLLNTIAGGLSTMMGVIVQSIFNKRGAQDRAGAQPSASPSPAETKP